MRNIIKINIKNFPYYTLNNKTNIRKFDPNVINIDKISFKSIDGAIYIIKYITMKSLDKGNIDNENSLCLNFNNLDIYIIKYNSIEESNRHKYFICVSTKVKY